MRTDRDHAIYGVDWPIEGSGEELLGLGLAALPVWLFSFLMPAAGSVDGAVPSFGAGLKGRRARRGGRGR